MRFGLELCAVAAMVVAGLSIGWVAGIVLPVLLITSWGWLIAPKSTHRLRDPWRLLTEIAIFLAVGSALAISGRLLAGLLLATTSIGVACVLRAVRAEPLPR